MPTTTVERPSSSEVTITVTIGPDDYRAAVNEELRKLARKVQLKGFRPGKVPMGYLKKLYGRGVVQEVIGKQLDAALNEAIERESLEIFGQLSPAEEPDLAGVDPDAAEELTFVFEGGLMPRIDEVDTSGLAALQRYTVRLSDEEAAEKVEGARKRFVDYVERDTVETEDDFATLVVADPELDAKYLGAAGEAHSAEPTTGNDAKDGAADADTAEHDGDAAPSDEPAAAAGDDPRQKYFLRASELVEESRYKLIDKSVGAEVILAAADLAEGARERFAKAIDGEDGGATTSFTIAKVDRETLPELDGETFEKIFGPGTAVASEDDAKAEFARRFAENSQANLDDFALEQIIDRLGDDNALDVPEKAIKARLEQARKDELDKAAGEGREPDFDHELTQADRHGLARRLKWLAFRQNLVEKYGIELEAADIDAGLERAYAQQMAGMGIDPEQYREQFFPMFKKNYLENREQVMEMTDGLLNAKLLRRLEDEGVLGERREVGEREFGEIVDAYNRDATAAIDALREQPL